MKPGDLVELRIGQLSAEICDEEGFRIGWLNEDEHPKVLIIDHRTRWNNELWFKVLHGEKIGYVREMHLQKVGEPNPVPGYGEDEFQ